MNTNPGRLFLYCELARPATLVLPMVGILSGGFTAAAAMGDARLPARGIPLLIAAAAAMLLNAASNTINQVADLEVDRVNKPSRPIVRGAVHAGEAVIVSLVSYGAAIALALTISVASATLFVAAAIATLIYSLPQFGRTKRFTWCSNLTIAIPRGCLLKVAGWSVIAPVNDLQPWIIGSVFALFLLGATTTKDFADVDGDRVAGCMTLPVRYGAQRSAWMIAPFFVLPWWLLPIATLIPDPSDSGAHLLKVDYPAMLVLASLLTIWGIWIARSILLDPLRLSTVENHPAWSSMYALAVTAHLGLVAAYWL